MGRVGAARRKAHLEPRKEAKLVRYIWTNAGDDPDFPTGDKHDIDGYFYPAFDSVTTGKQLLATQQHGAAKGLYAASNWGEFAGKTPAAIATLVANELKRVRAEAPALTNIRFQWNNETHDPATIASELEAMRSLMPNLGLSWSLEGMQGGWMDATFVQRILTAKVRVVPEAYYGAEGRIDGLYAADIVLRNLTRRGFPETSVSLMYDAAALPRDWDGYAFIMGRLP